MIRSSSVVGRISCELSLFFTPSGRGFQVVRLLAAVWLVIPFAGTGAIEPKLVIRSWGTVAGLPQNTVNAIQQTKDGYLWLGTSDGLARFDGVHFTVYGLKEGLRSVEVSALYEDRAGTLWAGTIGGGLSRLAGERFESVSAPNREFAIESISCVAEDVEGRLWIGTPSGIVWLKSGVFLPRENLGLLARTPIRAIIPGGWARGEEGEKVMWVATRAQGLFRVSKQQVIPSTGPPGDERISAYCLLADREGRLWAAIGNGKILCLEAGRWHTYTQADGVPFAYVTSLAQGADGKIWAGSLDDGLYWLENGRFHALKKQDGLSADDIRSLRFDREANLWVGTRTGGLSRINRGKVVQRGAAQGLTNEFTRSITEEANGTIWVATTGGGLYSGNLDGFRQFAPEPIIAYYAQAESVLSASDGSLWWGGGRSLLRWQGDRLTGCFTNQPWVRAATITALTEDGAGGLWIGNSEGVVIHYRNGLFREFSSRVARGPVTALSQSGSGLLWVGSPGGLAAVQPDSEAVFPLTNGLVSQSIRTLHIDRQGALWIGTAGGGLSRWRARKGTVARPADGFVSTFTTRQGLGMDTISQIIEDDQGSLWLGGARGILRVRKSELEELAAGKISFLHPRVYGINDGMPAEECSGGFCPAGLKTRSGLICFSTVKGLVFLDPNQEEESVATPDVLLEQVKVNGIARELPANRSHPGKRDVAGDPASQFVPRTAVGLPRLVIPPGSGDLELHYTGISFTAPERISFRYRLEGLDTDWLEAGGRRTAYYNHVPPGDFVFRVIACNADGVWNEHGVALALTIQAYPWQAAWFQISAGALVIALMSGAFYLLQRRRFKQRLVLLEAQNAVTRERLRISQDMHDHIGGMLTQVSQLSDLGLGERGETKPAPSTSPAGASTTPVAGPLFEKIGVQARAAVQALDEIIWATNPRNDNLPRFAEYVSRFADEFFENTSVRCWQDIPTDLPQLPLRAEARHNVFLAFREVLHNVLKHSGAHGVWVRLSLQDREVRLETEDNGCGFEMEASRDGNGLGNMQSRLTEAGGRALVKSRPGSGTKVSFEFPTG